MEISARAALVVMLLTAYGFQHVLLLLLLLHYCII